MQQISYTYFALPRGNPHQKFKMKSSPRGPKNPTLKFYARTAAQGTPGIGLKAPALDKERQIFYMFFHFPVETLTNKNEIVKV